MAYRLQRSVATHIGVCTKGRVWWPKRIVGSPRWIAASSAKLPVRGARRRIRKGRRTNGPVRKRARLAGREAWRAIGGRNSRSVTRGRRAATTRARKRARKRWAVPADRCVEPSQYQQLPAARCEVAARKGER